MVRIQLTYSYVIFFKRSNDWTSCCKMLTVYFKHLTQPTNSKYFFCNYIRAFFFVFILSDIKFTLKMNNNIHFTVFSSCLIENKVQIFYLKNKIHSHTDCLTIQLNWVPWFLNPSTIFSK